MPYGISETQTDCENWATVKKETDGSFTTVACHENKQDAIDQMVAVSISEELEPLGDVSVRQIADDMGEIEVDLSVVQTEMYDFYEDLVGSFGQFDQGVGEHGAHYSAESPFESEGLICGNCVFYEGGQKCELVSGQISSNGICKLWIIPEKLLQPDETYVETTPMADNNYKTDEYRAVDLSAPAFMRASAKRGLALHEQGFSGDGLVPATVADARRMANGEALSENKWRKISPWIARHIVDLDAVQGDEITAGLVAMLLWGGGASKASARRAQAYAERVVAKLDETK